MTGEGRRQAHELICAAAEAVEKDEDSVRSGVTLHVRRQISESLHEPPPIREVHLPMGSVGGAWISFGVEGDVAVPVPSHHIESDEGFLRRLEELESIIGTLTGE